ncbi:SDR family NAD(P)-dependent oxidoreductase [Muricoccus vinaceus]|uniref:SDR family NAD(P)-dependent oxidoreductase n=1 Tax=Muricoccus vinaceus TaxID=424704 RepID=A0ABV6IVB4_9PROT
MTDSANPNAVIARGREGRALDLLVVNARIPILGDPLERDADEVDRMVRSNVGANLGFPGSAAYSTTKSAVRGKVRGLTRDFGQRGITVNAVQPGSWIRT